MYRIKGAGAEKVLISAISLGLIWSSALVAAYKAGKAWSKSAWASCWTAWTSAACADTSFYSASTTYLTLFAYFVSLYTTSESC